MRRSRRAPGPISRFGAITLTCAVGGAVGLWAAGVLSLLSAWVLAVSLVTFVTYGYDKWVAGSGRMRVPERVLLGLALVGGTVGAVAGMFVFRHKTAKPRFWGRLVGIGVIQAALLAVVYLAL